MPELDEYQIDKPDMLDEAGSVELSVRSSRIDKAWKYYRGEHDKPLVVRPGMKDDNVIINLAQKTIDQAVSMLFGEMPTITLADHDMTQQLNDVWELNEWEILLHNLGMSGGLAGHVFVKMVPDARKLVRLVSLNPRLVSVFWRPDDMGKVVCYRVQWISNLDTYRQDIVDQDGSWLIVDWKKDNSGQWKKQDVVVWDYAFAPIVDWQNLPDPENYYGAADLVNPGLNDNINFIASNVARIIKYHAHPKTVALGVDKDQITETAVDGLWAIPDPNAKVKNVEMQSDLGSSMGILDFLQASFYSQHRAVDLATMKDKIGQLTNFGLRTLFKDSLDKLKTKQTLYGNAIEEISYRMGVMMGCNWGQPEVTFGDPLPVNMMEQTQTQQLELGMGVESLQTASETLGHNWELEQERMSKEKDNTQLGLGQAIANAMRGFDKGNQAASPMMADGQGQNGQAQGMTQPEAAPKKTPKA